MSRGRLLILAALLVAAAIVRSGVFAGGGEDRSRTGQLGGVVLGSQPAQLDAERQDLLPPERRAAADGNLKMPVRLALGQMIVARFNGPGPPPAFLARIRKGEVGGVILFEENLRHKRSTVADLVRRLQATAAAGGNPPLLVMVDQEGGTVKRLPGPPAKAAARMTSDDADAEGEATGNYLAQIGINVDLAPVADVRHPGSFLGSRTFSSNADEVATLACAFAAGLRSQSVAATLKHFPGLGRASVNTDEAPVTVDASVAELRADYDPYEQCADEPLTLIMVDSAVYPRLTGGKPAVMSPDIYRRELPRIGTSDVTISDDLEAPAIQSETTPARRSIDAGLDLLLYARTESTSAEAYERLLEDVEAGPLSASKVDAAAAKILALKAELAG